VTKEDLKEYQWIVRNIKHLESQLEEAQAQAESVSSPISGEGGGGGGDGDKMASNVCNIITIKEKIEDELQKAREAQSRIMDAIARLPRTEALVIRLRYIEGLEWDNVSSRMNYSYAQAHRVHRCALRSLKGQ
jgi:DNA-directed RNA polymerase specialized sigma subunit